MQSYLDKRDLEIDRTEWIDILCGIKAVVSRPAGLKIVELCAGKGYLLEFLSRRLPHNEYIGVDLEGCKYSNNVKCVDLNKEYPPKGDIYIFQHCIEHLDQNRVVELMRYCLDNGVAIVGIVPAHKSDDPTHVVNHYHYDELLELINKVETKHYYIRPDLLSYVNPSDLDYLVILSNIPIDKKKAFPKMFRYVHGIFRRLFNKLYSVTI